VTSALNALSDHWLLSCKESELTLEHVAGH